MRAGKGADFPFKKEYLTRPKHGRLIAVSDIHGNLDYFKGLLDKIALQESDSLIILGDFVEKGPQSLDTLRFIMELGKRFDVHPVCGNCDIWAQLIYDRRDVSRVVLDYMDIKPMSLARQMLREIGMEFSRDMDYLSVRSALLENFGPEFDYLRALPAMIETEDFVFVHGGVPDAPEENGWKYMRFDAFSQNGKPQEKWTVAGHWPVMLYHENIVSANPVINREKRIISIDGGCVLKDDGQLNAFIIAPNGEFSFDFYDCFPTAIAKTAQSSSEKSWYIRWGDAQVEVLNRGEEFSRIRHVRTGYEMEVLTKYIYENGTVNDCTDYVLPVSPGDELRIVERTSRGYFAKKNGISGWYYGEI